MIIINPTMFYCLIYNLIMLWLYLTLTLLHVTYIYIVRMCLRVVFLSSSNILRFRYVTISITKFDIAFSIAKVHPNHAWRRLSFPRARSTGSDFL